MRAYFDRTKVMYLSKEPSFDGIEVEVSSAVMNAIHSRKQTQKAMVAAIDEAGAPEDSAQTLTDLFTDLLETEAYPIG